MTVGTLVNTQSVMTLVEMVQLSSVPATDESHTKRLKALEERW